MTAEAIARELAPLMPAGARAELKSMRAMLERVQSAVLRGGESPSETAAREILNLEASPHESSDLGRFDALVFGLVAHEKSRSSGILHAEKLDARVISVGNLQAGGSGKTPVVARIAREACERGLKTCILSRGYLSEWEIHGGLIEPGLSRVDPARRGRRARASSATGSGRLDRRRRESRPAVQERRKNSLGSKFDLVILDDGFQHWKIARDVEILVMTSSRPGEKIFPRLAAQVESPVRSGRLDERRGAAPHRRKALRPCSLPCMRDFARQSPFGSFAEWGIPLSVAKTAKFSGFKSRVRSRSRITRISIVRTSIVG